MKKLVTTLVAVALTLALTASAPAAGRKQKNEVVGPFPVLLLEGGRRLEFVRTISSEKEINPNRSFWNRVLDVIAGPPEWHRIVRPYGVATDSHGRIIVTDPGALAVHVFDFEKKKYWYLEGGKHEPFQSPIGVAVDADDNFYVTDSRLGKIFVFDAHAKFVRFLGALPRGEGFFKRPTGIAINKAQRRVYVSDTLRDKVYVLDLEGNVLHSFGGRGSGPGQFNFPTEIAMRGNELLVVDAMNFRVQRFDERGGLRGQFGSMGTVLGSIYRPKGLGIDPEGNAYLVDAALEAVQVFNPQGQLLYSFGRTGGGPAQFELPSGLWIDSANRIFIADSYNRRVQVFQFTTPQQKAASGGQQ